MLGPPGRIEILRALYYQPDAASLRQLARLADVHPHTAELVLRGLVSERLVVRRTSASRVFYTKDTRHSHWLVIGRVCDGADSALRQLKRPLHDRQARTLLPFIEQTTTMLAKARGSRRVP
jgi:hypothetical protein